MSPATGPLLAAALLLALAGAAKLRRPAPTGLALTRAGLPGSDGVVRVLGGVEILAATAALLLGGTAAASLVVLYLAFAGFTALQVRRADGGGAAADCGCFGDASAPAGWGHVVANLALAGAAAWAVATSADGLLDAAADAPLATVLVTVLAAVAAVAIRGLLTDMAAVDALIRPTAATT